MAGVRAYGVGAGCIFNVAYHDKRSETHRNVNIALNRANGKLLKVEEEPLDLPMSFTFPYEAGYF